MLTFYVPPGIGDFSAMYSKLCKLNREIVIRTSNDSPNRLSPFLEILPKVKDGGYAAHNAMISVGQTLPPGTDLGSLPDGEYFLAINQWLEDGGSVEKWIPGEMDYHYEFRNEKYKEPASTFIKALDKDSPRIGIYCSAYGNARHWGFWTYEEWRKFIELLVPIVPKNTQFILLGAEYDLAIAEYLYEWMQSDNIPSYLTLGAFHIGTTVEVIRSLDYFFVFPSGLGFIADVVNTPNMMWFPENLRLMRGTFCDPYNYECKKTIHSLFTTPELAVKEFVESGLKHCAKVEYAR